jgi:hypothetical protein
MLIFQVSLVFLGRLNAWAGNRGAAEAHAVIADGCINAHADAALSNIKRVR